MSFVNDYQRFPPTVGSSCRNEIQGMVTIYRLGEGQVRWLWAGKGGRKTTSVSGYVGHGWCSEYNIICNKNKPYSE